MFIFVFLHFANNQTSSCSLHFSPSFLLHIPALCRSTVYGLAHSDVEVEIEETDFVDGGTVEIRSICN